MSHRWAPLLAVLAACALPATAAAQVAPHPFGKEDGGGFHNILPPGSNGLANVAEGAAFLATGARPANSDDQLAMYGDLVYTSPGLSRESMYRFFKDATFGVRPGDEGSLLELRPDVTIQRDRSFGVPRVTASTRDGAMFGLGYATAQDRLFLTDVLRNVGRARVSSFVGGARGNRQLDREQWEIAPYTEADLQRQYDDFDDLYGADGARVQRDIEQYIAGINRYVAEARIDPTKMPAEYAAIGQPTGPEPFQVTDPVAIASLVGGIFGKGGGQELRNALALQAARKRFGSKRGTAVFRDFRAAQDPEHEATLRSTRAPYQEEPRRRAKGVLAMPDPDSVTMHEIGPDIGRSRSRAAGPQAAPESRILQGIAGLRERSSMSNALLVAGRHTRSGRPIAVFGPQVAYFSPQILMEQEVHAPTLQARGAAFPGTNLYVQLGRGRDYAWSATSSSKDNTDTFAVELCEPGGGTPTKASMHYRFRGACEPIEVVARENRWSPTPADQTPAGSETLTAHRTKLGLVVARATIGGRPHAYVRLRSTYRHEIDSALGFSDLNDPARIRGWRDFNRAIHKIGYTFHWFYSDAENIAMYDSGNVPLRAAGTPRDLPVRGLPRFEWRGFDPDRLTAEYEPPRRRPQAVDEDYLVNWNNAASRGYRAADQQWQYGSVHRVRTLGDRIRRLLREPRKLEVTDVIDAMEDAGTVDVRGAYVVPFALDLLRGERDPALRRAIAQLRAWSRSGGNRRDKDRDGVYEHAEAIKLMDAWFPRLVRAQFEPVLGPELYATFLRSNKLEDTPNDNGNRTNSHATSGWYSYVQKDLRRVLGRKVRAPYSRRYCGGGSRARCRALLRRTLREAIAVDAAELYRDPKCDRPGDQVCFDAVFHRPFGLVDQPLIHWINRPTFQQVVEVERRLPRE